MNHNRNHRRVLTTVTGIAVLLVIACAAFAATANHGVPVRFEYKILQQTHITKQTLAKMKQQSQGAPSESGAMESENPMLRQLSYRESSRRCCKPGLRYYRGRPNSRSRHDHHLLPVMCIQSRSATGTGSGNLS